MNTGDMNITEKQLSWWKSWLALGFAFGSTVLIFNAFFGRFPLFAVKSCRPIVAIPVGCFFEVLVWVVLALTIGILAEVVRRIFRGRYSWHLGARVGAVLGLEAYLVRSLLAVYMRNGLFRFHAPPLFHDAWILTGIIVVALGITAWVVWDRRSADYRTFKWDDLRVTILASGMGAIYAIVHNRWMSTTSLPLPGVFVWVMGVAVVVILLAFFCRAQKISSWRLAGLLGLTALIAVVVLTVYYIWPSDISKPNIIISLWDTARADSMSLYGYKNSTTPGLDSLTSRAVVFDNAYTPSNYTYPSHVSFFTGKTYREHGFHIGDGHEVNRYQNEFTLPEQLRNMGYYTALFTENSWVLACDKGFDEVRYFPMLAAYFGPPPRTCEFGTFPPLRKYAGPFPGRMIVDALAYYFDGFYTFSLERIQLRCLQTLLIKSRRIGPLFVFWNWFTVHDRYHPYTEWPIGKEVDNYDFASEYELSIRYADERFMKIYRLVKCCGRLENTFLIVTSDHGEFIGEKDLWGHNKTLFKPVLRVPLFITHPSLQYRRVGAPVSLTDFRPLVEYLAGGRMITAEKIERVLTGREKVIAEHGFLPEEHSRVYDWCYSVIDDTGQYINDPLIKTYGSTWRDDDPELLLENTSRFNRERDLSTFDQSRASQLKKYYQDYVGRLNERKRGLLPPGTKAARERKLRALGYL